MQNRWLTGLTTLAVCAVIAVSGAACSSSEDSSTSAGSDGTTAADRTWCDSVKDLVDQAGGGDLSVSGDMAALNEAIVSLAATAPAEINDELQTLATTSQAAVDLGTEPGATLPPQTRDAATAAWVDLDTWVAANCGLSLPTLGA